jgi:hypothetical protein
MAFDIAEWTVRVLDDGLPPLPAQLKPGQTVAVARWRGQRHGAVVFVRLWKNGNVDNDCAIAERAPDGSWEEPSAWGGTGWIDDPLVRSQNGWDGDPVAWLGLSGIGFEVVDESDYAGGPDDFQVVDVVKRDGPDEDTARPRFAEEPWAGLAVRALLGAASEQVAAIEVEHGGRTWEVPIESPCGAFIVGVEGPGPATLRVLGHDGQPLPDADGATERVA